jgi:hypothetical protein
MMASNDAHVVRASRDERRFFVLDVGSDQQQQGAYFGAITADLESGGYENLLHFLLTYDLDAYDVRRPPRTAALRDQQESTLEGIERLIFEMLKNAELPFHTPRTVDGRPMVGTLQLQTYAHNTFIRDASEKKIGTLLRQLEAERRRQGGAYWVLPPVAAARRAWAQKWFEADWDEATDWHIPAAESSKGPF